MVALAGEAAMSAPRPAAAAIERMAMRGGPGREPVSLMRAYLRIRAIRRIARRVAGHGRDMPHTVRKRGDKYEIVKKKPGGKTEKVGESDTREKAKASARLRKLRSGRPRPRSAGGAADGARPPRRRVAARAARHRPHQGDLRDHRPT